jgi:predicted AAA+ superfamily ATPase
LQSKSKYYASDLGLLTIKTFDDITFNYGYRLENAVLLKLLESNYQVFTGEDRYKNEIDFVIKKGNVTKYIQVCETLDERIFERESRSLLNIKDAYEKIILTLNIGVSHTKGIKIINLQKYLKEEVSI